MITIVLYIELNCFALAVLLLIWLSMRRHGNYYLYEQRQYLAMVYITALLLMLDAVMWYLDGRPGRETQVALYVVTVCYYVLNPVICLLWCLYVDYHVYRNIQRLKKRLIPLSLPALAAFALTIMSVFNSAIFYIDENNVYHRGPYVLAIYGLSFIYILYASVFLFKKRRLMTGNENTAMLLFVVPPTVGSIIQMMYYGVPLIWICVTFSLLIIYINVQNDQLYRDYLTDVYNRKQLDNYLKMKIEGNCCGAIAGLMIDLDSFKLINDQYGHSSGDQALKNIADILKGTFRRSDFVARYGGDEFVVIMEMGDRSDLDKAIKRLYENMAHFNASNSAPYELSVSIGYDYYEDGKSALDFLRHIDALMYEDKQAHKNESEGHPESGA